MRPEDVLLIVVMGLATYRLTRLVVRDEFPPVRVPREWLAGTEEAGYADGRGPGWLGDLVTCHWCASGWLSLGLVAGVDAFTSVPLPVVVWFAVWGIGALVAHLEPLGAGYRTVSATGRVVTRDETPVMPSSDAMLESLRDEWGTLVLVRRALRDVTPEARDEIIRHVQTYPVDDADVNGRDHAGV